MSSRESVQTLPDSKAPPPEIAQAPGTLPAPSGLSPNELAAFERMNDAMRVQALKMRDMILTEGRNLLESRYNLGLEVKKVKDDQATYGDLSDI
jgi:hypothetical protein